MSSSSGRFDVIEYHRGAWREGNLFRKGRKLYFQPFSKSGYLKPVEVKLW